ncbi:HpcH/HpaI aldolase family protein [Blastococcus capsensis]|uniref:HpcH/HpaI aldolase family protein n=1 Tax=Blastococcus capsensis TaxID=1564163 RepID=UPI00253FB591|nr:aldolase/citrate lyase family protein [Blastococcus capsensis]MDK3258464.1 aldolase/citrate lyase family protein [Blastococcus capsensis]
MSLKKLFTNDGVALGMMLSGVSNPGVVSMISTAGLDYFILDMEHGPFDWSDMAAMIGIARGAGIRPIVRIPEIRRETVLKPLDAGAAGLLVPMVDTVEQAEEIVRHAKYAPQGQRGTALRRGHSDYAKKPAVEYMARVNEETTIAIQIESREAVKNAEALAAVPGIDALFIGPFDLSVDMGLTGQASDPQMREVYRTVLAAAKASGKVAGIHLFDTQLAKSLIEEGFQMVSVSSDIDIIVDQTAANVSALRG